MPILHDDLERRIVRLAIPALGTLAVEPLYVLVDTAIVGRLGTPQLAGLAIASTVLLTVISLTAALEYGLTPDVAFAHGRDDAPEARRIATNGLQLAAMIGVPIGLALGIAARPLCWVLGGRGEVLEHAGPVHLKELSQCDTGNRRPAPVLFLVEKLLGVAVGEGLDHERSSSPEGIGGIRRPRPTRSRESRSAS